MSQENTHASDKPSIFFDGNVIKQPIPSEGDNRCREEMAFEGKWHYKVVKPKTGKFTSLDIPVKEYVVIAALLNREKDTIFAIKSTDYSLENKCAFTLNINQENLHCLDEFEILRDGYYEFVKPVILDEFLLSWTEKGDEWETRFSSYVFPEKCGINLYKKENIKRNVKNGDEEYVFVYKSIFDFGKNSHYSVKLPKGLEYKRQVLDFVGQFRQDVLDNQVCYGVNRRLLQEPR